jgi:hypothetical protein
MSTANWSQSQSIYGAVRNLMLLNGSWSQTSSSIRPGGLVRFHSIFLTVFLCFFFHVVCNANVCLEFWGRIHSFNVVYFNFQVFFLISFLLWSRSVKPAVFLINFISAACSLFSSAFLIAQASLP